MRLTKSQISSGIKHAQQSTWGNRYNPVTPSIKKENGVLILSTMDDRIIINNFDEIVLTIIAKFLFMPVWLIKQCYNFDGFQDFEDTDKKINDWISIGLIWKEDSVTGQYVRPTYSLFSLYGIPPYTYTNIPFNTLTHTISEEKVMFDIMSGRSEIIKKENIKIPKFSELGLPNYTLGTNVIAEEDFRFPSLYTDKGIQELIDIENKINNGIKNGETITPELEDFKYFVIANKVDSTGNNRKDWNFHLPDLCIPIPRDKGKSKSIAIEVELTNKRNDYVESLKRYKNNNKYESVYWLCNSNAIAQSLKNAFKEIGGCGSCKVVLQEFVIPSPEF